VKIVVKADKSNLGKIFDFVNKELSLYNCDESVINKINIAIEEIFVNIASYAYEKDTGEVEIACEIFEKPLKVEISFLDSGKEFNPLAYAEPDTLLALEDRKVGGLGILLTKKLMDGVKYEYVDGKNVLKIEKELK